MTYSLTAVVKGGVMGSQTDSNIINSLIIHLNTTKWSWSLNSQQTFAKVNMELKKKEIQIQTLQNFWSF